uniref:Uncharacterized protein n=1 Tax=Oryza meridionalis TaxID=40149 RepID=A0A0E0DQW3_9ORYZ
MRNGTGSLICFVVISKLAQELAGSSFQINKRVSLMLEKWAPEAEHRNCARHIYANWKRHFHEKQFQKKFWRCAKAPCRMLFNLARAKLAQMDIRI